MPNKLDYSYKAFEALVTYAVDEISDGQEFNILKDFGFNEESFFKEVYIAREKKEREIEMELRKHQAAIIIKGYPGTGKTTIIRKILSKLKGDENAYIVYIDFKVINKANGLNGSYNSIAQTVKELIKANLTSYLSSEHISDYAVIDSFINSPDYLKSPIFNNPAFSRLYRQLINMHDFGKSTEQETFIEWYQYQRNHAKSDKFNAVLEEMTTLIEPHNYLYYVSHFSKYGKRLVVLCFDNVDSIIDNKTRDAFREFARQYPSEIKESTKVMLAIRTSNPTFQGWTDTGAYIVTPIELGYDEFIDESKFEIEIKKIQEEKGFVLQEDRAHIRRELLREAIEKFASEICEKRIGYFNRPDKRILLKKAFDADGKSEVDDNKMQLIQNCFYLLLDTNRIRPAFFELCNYSRREMLIAVNNFTLYLIDEIGADVDNLNKNSSKNFIIESYFYGWIFNNRLYLQPEFYNFAIDLAKFKDAHNMIGCSIDHLVLLSIFNLSSQQRSEFSYDKTVRIKRVINSLVELGFERDDILSSIFNLYKDKLSGMPKGILELSRFWEIQDFSDIIDEDEIGLTPKSFFMICHGCVKFINILTSLRFAKYETKGVVFTYEDKTPVTKYNIRTAFEFLHELGNMHLSGLERVKASLRPKLGATWLIYYKKTFCLPSSQRRQKENKLSEGLLFSNIMNSIILFLDHQKSFDSTVITPGIIEAFRKLDERYEEEVIKIVNDRGDRKELNISSKTLSIFA